MGNERELLQLLKFMYTSFVTVCKRVSRTTMPGINFLINCMQEMYDINPVIAYKDAFKRLRSIAFHCKQSIQIMAKHCAKNSNKSKQKQHKLETVQSVYNWRFINIIRLWSKILGAHANKKNSDLHLLCYPFVQICCSVLTLTRSAAYNPGRLKIMQSLCDLIASCQHSQIMDRRIFVPLAPYLISILNNPAFAKEQKTKKDAMLPFDIMYKVKIGDAHFDTHSLHESLLNNVIKLMLQYFSFYSYSIAFPEISFPTLVFLREFAANSNIDSSIKSKVKILSVKLRENANWIVVKRKGVDFSPKDFEKVAAFLAAERVRQISPLAKFVKSEQFEKITSSQTIGIKSMQQKKEKNVVVGAKNKNKKMKKKKKRNRSKMEKERQQKDKKIDDEMKRNYDEKIIGSHQNGNISNFGDVVQDFELSD